MSIKSEVKGAEINGEAYICVNDFSFWLTDIMKELKQEIDIEDDEGHVHSAKSLAVAVYHTVVLALQELVEVDENRPEEDDEFVNNIADDVIRDFMEGDK